jgi:hypothetical protein
MADQLRWEGWFGRQPESYQKEYLGEEGFKSYQADKSSLPTYRQTVVNNPITMEQLQAEDEKLLSS